MHSQLFSNKTRGFYPIESLRYYKSVEALPDDLVRITDEEHARFIGAAPESNLVPNYNTETKQMEWLSVNQAVKSPEEILSQNRSVQLSKQREAALSAFPLQSAVDLGTASEDVREKLDELKRYVVALTSVDLTATVPEWPAIPEWVTN